MIISVTETTGTTTATAIVPVGDNPPESSEPAPAVVRADPAVDVLDPELVIDTVWVGGAAVDVKTMVVTSPESPVDVTTEVMVVSGGSDIVVSDVEVVEVVDVEVGIEVGSDVADVVVDVAGGGGGGGGGTTVSVGSSVRVGGSVGASVGSVGASVVGSSVGKGSVGVSGSVVGIGGSGASERETID